MTVGAHIESDGTIIGWHLGHVGPELAAALPGWRYVAAPSPSAPMPRPPGRVVLVGYSAGCQGVRAALLGAIPSPDAAVTIDGTHADPAAKGQPPSGPKIDVWRNLAAVARRGERLWLATCLSAHDYVETLPVGTKGRAASTVRVLEAATGVELYEESDRPPSGLRSDGTVTGRPAECRVVRAHDDGALHLRSYASAHTDHAEHAAQVSRVLPALWRDVVVPWLAGASDTDPAPPPSGAGGHDLPPRPLGLRVVDIARSYLGLREIPGPQADPTIQRMLAGARRGGTATAGMFDDRSGAQTLGSRPDDSIEWCAASGTTCVAEALLPGDVAPCGRRAACWEVVADARTTGRWHDVSSGYAPQDGDLELEGRAGGDPRIPGQAGHIGIRVGAQRIDGNSSDSMRLVPGGGPKVVGWVQVSPTRAPLPAIDDEPTPTSPGIVRDDGALAMALDRMARDAIGNDIDRGPDDAA